MTKWEYRVINMVPNGTDDERQWLNILGSEGWGLVAVVKTAHSRVQTAYFRREVQDEA